MSYIFTSESVAKGHPDKVSDYIADSILDYCLTYDPNSRCAIEVALAHTTVYIFGEVRTKADMAQEKIIEVAKEAIKFCGYDHPQFTFEANTATYHVNLHQQSGDIALGVDERDGKEMGAGDQGIMFGYAKNDTDTLLPLPIYLAHKLTERLAYVREEDIIKGLGPDGKSQVSVRYNENNEPLLVDAVVLSTQHIKEKSLAEVRKDVMEHVIKAVIPEKYLHETTKYYINPTGRFVTGGPVGDSGLTGRKIIVDTYGGLSRHGGGAFSGKDATKVDRSASYMARYLAKQVVASGIAQTCEIQLAYAIGVPEPVALYVNTFGTSKVDDQVIQDRLLKHFKLTPKAMIEKLGLNRPIFKNTVHFGHFGKRSDLFAWEKLDNIDIFKDLL